MTTPNRKLGNIGETLATSYLQSQGFEIVVRNWICPHGEIDIIVIKQALMRFVEVKTSRSADAGLAIQNFTPRKRNRIINTIWEYLNQNQLPDSIWQLDLIIVTNPKSHTPTIQHMEDILDW